MSHKENSRREGTAKFPVLTPLFWAAGDSCCVHVADKWSAKWVPVGQSAGLPERFI